MVKSVQRAIRILEVLGRQEHLTLAALSRKLIAPKTTVFEILATLESERLVHRDDELGTYSLGIKLLELGQMAQCGLELCKLVLPFLQRLNRELDETVHLTVLDQDEVLYIDCIESSKRLRTYSVIGVHAPLHCTAVGKALLAALPPGCRDAIVRRIPLPRFTNSTITDRGQLMNELERIAQRGYAIDNVEHEEGVRCVGAAVINLAGDVVASISVSGPTQRISMQSMDTLAAALLATTRDISQRLGAVTPLHQRSRQSDALLVK